MITGWVRFWAESRRFRAHPVIKGRCSPMSSVADGRKSRLSIY